MTLGSDEHPDPGIREFRAIPLDEFLAESEDDPKPIPPDPEEWARFTAADKAEQWATLIRHQPELRELERHAQAIRDPGDTEWFCANSYWYGYSGEQSIKTRVTDLTGWTVDHLDGLLGSDVAYSVAYRHLHSLLPNCRGDCPCETGAFGARPRKVDR